MARTILSTDDFVVHQLVSARRPQDDGVVGPDTSVPMTAALVAAHSHLSGNGAFEPALFNAWVRDPGGATFRVMIGGRPSLPGIRPSLWQLGRDALMYPPGAIGVAKADGELERLAERFPCWVRCAGEPNILWADETHDGRDRAGSFVDYAAHVGQPFAWLVVAEPLTETVVAGELLALANDIPRLRLRENLETDRVALERAEARFRELSRASISGLWNIHILVGALTPTAARSAASQLCTAADIDRLPYVLTPIATDQSIGTFEEVWHQQGTRGEARSPFSGGTDLLAALTAPPAHELPGIRLLEANAFDVTPEDSTSGGMDLGTVLDRAHEPASPFSVGRATLNRHAFVCGATGSGKSQTTRWLLEQMASSEDPVPWLVLEPAKAEYARMAGRLAGRAAVLRLRPGDPDSPPASLNPLEPAPGFPLQSHVDLIRALFLAAFEATEPFPQVLAQALVRTYRNAGWDLVTGEPRPAHRPRLYQSEDPVPVHARYPQLDDLQSEARRVVDDIGYGKEIAANVRGFVEVRIGSLLHGTPGRFFRGGHPLDIDTILQQNVVLELENITDDQDKAFLIGALIIRIVEHLRVRHGARGCDSLQHVTIIEEAHRLLKRVDSGPAAAAVDLFASLLAEIRAYGEGIIVVEQIPSKIVPDVIKNTALKVMHRLPGQDDRDAVGDTINLTDEQSRSVVSLPPGVAAVAADGMDRPLLIRVPTGVDREDATTAHDRAPFTARRSELCGPACLVEACTLRQMNDAYHVSRDSRVVVWVEAVVIGHLRGSVPPLIGSSVRASFTALEPREVDCALSYAVETSVAARRHLLRRYLDPNDLELQVHRQLRYQLDHGERIRVHDYRRWQAGHHRYRDVELAIQEQFPGEKDIERVLLFQWGKRGINTSDPSPRALQRAVDQRRKQELGSVLLGDATASGLTAAIKDLAGLLDQASVHQALASSCIGKVEEIATEINQNIRGRGILDDGNR